MSIEIILGCMFSGKQPNYNANFANGIALE